MNKNIEVLYRSVQYNGYYLGKNMIDEYKEIGMGSLCVAGYGPIEYERLDWYRSCNKNVIMNNLSCANFLHQVCVYSNGNIRMNCLDYKHPYSLGNVYANT